MRITEQISLITELPIQDVECFQFQWKPNYHASLELVGYMNRKVQWEPVKSYGQRIEIYLGNEDVNTLFHGYIVAANFNTVGGQTQIRLEAMSASCLLDCEETSCSFQEVYKTYGNLVHETVKREGGLVIRNKKSDKEIGKPIIRYKETTWGFAVRLAGHLKSCVIPDMETGNKNIWFGMREGKIIPSLLGETYTIQMRSGKDAGIRYKVESRERYKIGDGFLHQGIKFIITEVEANYVQGELIFTYVLDEKISNYISNQIHRQFAGLGLWGTIKNVKGDMVKIDLDIDEGEDTGTYYYPWHPDTGNALYAMPEKGTRVLLCLYNEGGQDGAVVHCINKKNAIPKFTKNRYLHVDHDENINLSEETLNLTVKNQGVVISDGMVSVRTSNKLYLSAEGAVRLRAKKIMFNTPDEIDICQGR